MRQSTPSHLSRWLGLPVPVSVYQHCSDLCDSTESGGICWSTFFVSAMTAIPTVYFDSPPDSGYSTDNLAPAVPSNLVWNYSGGWDDRRRFPVLHSLRRTHPRRMAAELGETVTIRGRFVGSVTASDCGQQSDPALLDTPSEYPRYTSYGGCPISVQPNPVTHSSVISIRLAAQHSGASGGVQPRVSTLANGFWTARRHQKFRSVVGPLGEACGRGSTTSGSLGGPNESHCP